MLSAPKVLLVLAVCVLLCCAWGTTRLALSYKKVEQNSLLARVVKSGLFLNNKTFFSTC